VTVGGQNGNDPIDATDQMPLPSFWRGHGQWLTILADQPRLRASVLAAIEDGADRCAESRIPKRKSNISRPVVIPKILTFSSRLFKI